MSRKLDMVAESPRNPVHEGTPRVSKPLREDAVGPQILKWQSFSKDGGLSRRGIVRATQTITQTTP
jgi:hypothetical protein